MKQKNNIAPVYFHDPVEARNINNFLKTHKNTLVICNGMVRSGSTLQYNICRLLVELTNTGEGLGAYQYQRRPLLKHLYFRDKIMTEHTFNHFVRFDGGIKMQIR